MIRFTFLFLFSILLSSVCAQQQMFLISSSVQPDQIDSLYYWFSADQEVFDSAGTSIENGEQVGRWNDLSGNNHNLINTGNGPTYEASGGPGGLFPAIRFFGDTIGSNEHYWESDALSVFVVMKFDSATRDAEENYILKFNAATNVRQWYAGGQPLFGNYRNSLRIFDDGGVSNVTRYEATQKNITYSAKVWRHTPGTTTFYENGVIATPLEFISGTSTGTIKDGNSPLRLGSADIQARISEIIVYSKYLSDTEREAIENYLNEKYNLY